MKSLKMFKTLALAVVFFMVCPFALPLFLGNKTTNAATNITPQYIIDRGGNEINIEDDWIHNSYGWCAEVFDGYLWMGTNRDLGASIINIGLFGRDQEERDRMHNMTGVPKQSTDQAGKIYRIRLADGNIAPDAMWELVFEDTTFSGINGFRKMQRFGDSLYVFAGLTNLPTLDIENPNLFMDINIRYSAVYRFGMGHTADMEPEIVLWERLNGWNPLNPLQNLRTEYFRASTVHNDTMFIGTWDSKIFYTNSRIPGVTIPNNMSNFDAVAAGWKVFDLAAHPNYDGDPAIIWDMVVYRDRLYAFVTGEGFRVYEINLTGNDITNADVRQIVGNHITAPFGPGLGNTRHVAASPFVFGDWVYVTTFSSGPAFLMMVASGQITRAFEELYTQGAIYRFQRNIATNRISWEIVVGDFGTAFDKDNMPVQVADTNTPRAGFFLGSGENTSQNQYIWWMTEHNGRLYASTWDMSIFTNQMPRFIIALMSDIGQDVYGEIIAEHFEEIFADIRSLYEDISATFNEEGAVEEIFWNSVEAAADMIIAIQEDPETSLLQHFLNLIGDIMQIVDDAAEKYETVLPTEELMGRIMGVTFAIMAVMEEIEPLLEEAGEEASERFAALFAAGLLVATYTLDRSNPEGFDLFVSCENGVTWSPVTVGGFGDPHNYGGRVLLSTDYGLFVFTANPFTGTQIWRLDNTAETGITHSASASVTKKVEETYSFQIEASVLDIHRNNVQITSNQPAVVTFSRTTPIELERTGDIRFVVDRITGPFGNIDFYNERVAEVCVYEYTISITAQTEFTGTLVVTITIGGVSTQITIAADFSYTPGQLVRNEIRDHTFTTTQAALAGSNATAIIEGVLNSFTFPAGTELTIQNLTQTQQVVAGTKSSRKGTDGTYTFRVQIELDGETIVTQILTLTVTATPYKAGGNSTWMIVVGAVLLVGMMGLSYYMRKMRKPKQIKPE